MQTFLALGVGALVVFVLGKLVPESGFLGLSEECQIGIIRICRQEDMDPNRPESEQKFCLFDHEGKKLLGRHSNYASALRQERLIQWKKHQ
jgi:hypothetical protein